MDKYNIVDFLRQTADKLEKDEIQVELDVNTKGDDPRATAVLRIIRKKVKPKSKDAIGVAILECFECKGKHCVRCDGFGWFITDLLEEGKVDYTKMLVDS